MTSTFDLSVSKLVEAALMSSTHSTFRTFPVAEVVIKLSVRTQTDRQTDKMQCIMRTLDVGQDIKQSDHYLLCLSLYV